MSRKQNWPNAALELARILPRAEMHPEVLAWCSRRRAAEKWAVAFSGGADSLALLLLVWAHWPERRRHLQALHFNHRLRGAESRGDAAFCRRVCAALGVTLIAREWKRAKSAARPSERSEERRVGEE